MMTPAVIGGCSASDMTHNRENPSKLIRVSLLHSGAACPLTSGRGLSQENRESRRGGALIDSPVEKAKAAPVPIWSLLSTGAHLLCWPAFFFFFFFVWICVCVALLPRQIWHRGDECSLGQWTASMQWKKLHNYTLLLYLSTTLGYLYFNYSTLFCFTPQMPRVNSCTLF